MARQKKDPDQYSISDYRLREVHVRLCVRDGDAYYSSSPLSGPAEAAAVMRDVMKDLDREMVSVVNLDNRLKPLNYNVVSIGGINNSLVPVQNVFKSAILTNSACVMLLHNHPSGDTSPSNEDTVYELFASMKELERMGLSPDIDHYEVMYTEELPAYENRFQFLESIYARFNMDRPDDFKGHSLSVSDIVVMKEGDRINSWYVDSIGFKELDSFVRPENYLKNAEMSMEDDYGMIDGIVNNGRKDEPAERTSVLEMLRGTGSKEMNNAVFRSGCGFHRTAGFK